MFRLYLNLFLICEVYISSSSAISIVRFALLSVQNLLSDSFPFITASLLDLHGFNPPPFWAVIQSVKQQLFVQSAVKATVVNSFQLFSFCNPIWCPNDHPHFHTEYWRGALHPCHEPNFQVLPCWDEFQSCESDVSCTSRLRATEPQVHNYCLLLFCLIAFGTKSRSCVLKTAGRLEMLLLALTCKLVVFVRHTAQHKATNGGFYTSVGVRVK